MASRPISVKLKAEDADSIVNALRKSGDAGKVMADQLEKSFTPAARAVDNLKRQLDPLYDAQVKATQATGVFDRALKAGTVSAAEHAKFVGLINQRYLDARAASAAFVAANQNVVGAINLNRQGLLSLQASGVNAFQALASGMSPFRVAMTESAQVIGALVQGGVVGLTTLLNPAVLAATAVAAALAGAYFLLRDNTIDAAEAQKTFQDALDKTNEFLETATEKTKRLAAEQKQAAIAAQTLAAAAQTEAAQDYERQIAKAKASQEQLERASIGAGGRGLSAPERQAFAAQIGQLTIQLQSAEAAADSAFAAIDKLIAGTSGKDRDEAEKTAKAIAKKQDETKAVEAYVQKLRDQLAAQKEEESQRAEIAAVIEGQAKAQEDYNKGLRDTPLLRQQEVDAIKQAVAETEKLKDSEKARHAAAQDARREAEQRAKEEQRRFERIVDEGTDRAADILYDAFTGKISSIGEFLKNTLLRATAQGIADAFIRPLIVAPAVRAAGGIAGSLGFGGGAFASPGSGGSSLSTLGTLGNVASLANGFGGSVFGGFTGAIDSLGASLGLASTVSGITSAGSIGAFTSEAALAGSGVGAGGLSLSGLLGPVGLGLGAFMLAGSLFGDRKYGFIGPKPSVGPGQAATLAYTDAARVYGAAADNGGNAGAAAAFVSAIGDMVTQAVAAAGGTGLANGGRSVSIGNNKNGFFVRTGGNNFDTRYGSQDEATAAALQYLLSAGVAGASGGVNTAIQNSLAGGSANNLLSDIQFAKGIDRLGLSQVEQAVAAINDQYDAQIIRAQKLGLETGKLVELRDKEIEQAQNATRNAAEQGALTASGGAASSIYSFLNAQSLAADSSLSPTGRLTEAQKQFGDLLSAVRGGDLSQVGALTGAAGNLLTIGRQNFASTVDFGNIESFVRSSLQSVASNVTSDTYIADQITKALAAADKSQADRDAELVKTLRSEMSLLRAKIEALAA